MDKKGGTGIKNIKLLKKVSKNTNSLCSQLFWCLIDFNITQCLLFFIYTPGPLFISPEKEYTVFNQS